MTYTFSSEIKGCASCLRPLSIPIAESKPCAMNHLVVPLQKDGMAQQQVARICASSSLGDQA